MTATLLAAEAAKGGFTDINLGTVIWAWVSFGVTFFILSKVAWPMLARKMEERELRIAEGLRMAENVKNELLGAAQQEIAELRERAKKEIALEQAKAAEDLKRATVELTLEASARLLKRELRDEDHLRLAREVVEEVALGL